MGNLEVLTTSQYPKKVQLDQWNSWATQNWSGISVSSRGYGFPAALAKLSIGSIKFAQVHSDESAVRRCSRVDDGNRLVLHFQRRGTTVNRQCGREVTLNSGDLTLLRLDETYLLDTSGGHDLLVAEFDEIALLERIGGCSLSGAMKFDPAATGVKMIGDLIDSLCTGSWGPIDAHSRGLVERSFLDLVALAVINNRHAVIGQGSNALFRRAVLEIQRTSCDIELSSTGLAQRLGVSPRALQLAFAEMGTTPMAYLLSRRLDLAASRLSLGAQNITEIAFDCGFGSSAHFSRCFSSRFGMSPRDYRKLRS